MTSDETQIQIFADWLMPNAKRMTKDNKKNPEYHVVARIRRPRSDKNCLAEKSWSNHVKNEQYIGSKRPTPPPPPKKKKKKKKITGQSKHNEAKDPKLKLCRSSLGGGGLA